MKIEDKKEIDLLVSRLTGNQKAMILENVQERFNWNKSLRVGQNLYSMAFKNIPMSFPELFYKDGDSAHEVFEYLISEISF